MLIPCPLVTIAEKAEVLMARIPCFVLINRKNEERTVPPVFFNFFLIIIFSTFTNNVSGWVLTNGLHHSATNYVC